MSFFSIYVYMREMLLHAQKERRREREREKDTGRTDGDEDSTRIILHVQRDVRMT